MSLKLHMNDFFNRHIMGLEQGSSKPISSQIFSNVELVP